MRWQASGGVGAAVQQGGHGSSGPTRTRQDPGSLLLGLCIGLPVGQSTLLDEYLHGRQPITTEPPRRLRRPGPDAVLRLSLRNGLTWGLVLGQYLGLCVGAVAAIAGGMYMAFWGAGLDDIVDFAVSAWLTVFLVVGLTAGLGLALNRGLGPWLFHHWLRHRLARQGLLPRRLPQFLAACSAPERGWLRGPVAFEFRHRGLRDHLAGDVPLREEARGTTGDEDDEPAEEFRLLKGFGLVTWSWRGSPWSSPWRGPPRSRSSTLPSPPRQPVDS